MRAHDLSAIALAVALSATAVACNSNDARTPQPVVSAGGASAPQTGAALPPASPPHNDLEPSTEAIPPLVLALEGPATLPDKGEIELRAKIASHRGMAFPTTVAILLPAGAKLVSGTERETLASVQPGDTSRVYRVSLEGKLASPIRVVVDAQAPGGGMGIHAEKSFPEAKELTVKPYDKNVPPPPVGRPVGKPPAR